MTVNSQRLLLAAAGASAAAAGLYVDDVFSCFLWDGHPAGGEKDIVAGIDLTEGGLVWTKVRNASDSHYLVDSEIGKTGSYYDNLATNLTGSLVTNQTYGVETFNDNGFTVDGSHPRINDGSKEYVSWIFRKAAGFFTVIKYSGNSTAGHNVAHDLGSVPGCILIKKLGGSSDWYVYHRGLNISKALRLNDDGVQVTGVWNSTAPTSTHFTLANNTEVNESGYQYIAYIFAHNDQSFGTDSDEAIIECGNYIGTGTVPHDISLGFEPQWLMIKRADGGSQTWRIFDTARGINTNLADPHLYPNQPTDEQNADDYLNVTPNGFTLTETNSTVNGNGDNYVYVAIRRPHKPPEAGTDVFQPLHVQGGTAMNVGFRADMLIAGFRDGGSSVAQINESRLLPKYQVTSTSDSAGGSEFYWDQQNQLTARSGGNFINWVFRRAPGFFDVVAWEGTSTSGSSTDALNHGLGAIPELIIGKKHSHTGNWTVYSSVTGINKELELNNNAAVASVTNMIKAAPTATTFTVGYGLNQDERYFIGYFFASLAGISKVGSYSGTGSNVGVDCGFTAGARFVLIKRTDSTGDWYVWDSTRGIVGGNDPYLLLNSTAAEVTNTDYIDPLNAGFTVTSSAPADLNASGGTYLFLAIA